MSLHSICCWFLFKLLLSRRFVVLFCVDHALLGPVDMVQVAGQANSLSCKQCTG